MAIALPVAPCIHQRSGNFLLPSQHEQLEFQQCPPENPRHREIIPLLKVQLNVRTPALCEEQNADQLPITSTRHHGNQDLKVELIALATPHHSQTQTRFSVCNQLKLTKSQLNRLLVYGFVSWDEKGLQRADSAFVQ